MIMKKFDVFLDITEQPCSSNTIGLSVKVTGSLSSVSAEREIAFDAYSLVTKGNNHLIKEYVKGCSYSVLRELAHSAYGDVSQMRSRLKTLLAIVDGCLLSGDVHGLRSAYVEGCEVLKYLVELQELADEIVTGYDTYCRTADATKNELAEDS